MAGQDHFETFARGMEEAATRKPPTEAEVQQAAEAKFIELFEALGHWNAVAEANYPGTRVSYAYSQFDAQAGTLGVDILATKANGAVDKLPFVIEGDLVGPRDQAFIEQYGGPPGGRWAASDLDDLLPRITAALLQSFRDG